jgi:tetratricopeptide (TPR) repeat protein
MLARNIGANYNFKQVFASFLVLRSSLMGTRRRSRLRRVVWASWLAAAPVCLTGCDDSAEEPVAPAAAPVLRSVVAQRHVESADRLLAEQNYEAAVQEFTAALDVMGGADEPSTDLSFDADVLYRRGVAYMEMGFPDTAAADFTHALRLRPNLGAAFAKRGEAYFRLRDYYKAVRDCTEAIRFDPNDADAYRYRGEAYAARGQYDLAAKDLEQAITLRPALEAEVRPLLAKSYYLWSDKLADAGDAAGAEAWLDKAHELDPTVVAAADADATSASDDEVIRRTAAKQVLDEQAREHLLAGEDHYRAGDYDAALASFTEAITLRPDYAEAYLRRGMTLMATDFPDTAVKDLELAVHNGVDTVEAYSLLGEAFLQLGSPHRAVLAATDALHADPTDALAYALRGRGYVELGKWDRGIADLEEAVRRDPRLVDDVKPALERAYQLRHAAQAAEAAIPGPAEST